jgi:small subunit ribosomal protein S20
MAKLKTGRHTSAIKQFRKSKKRQQSNEKINSMIRTLAGKVEQAVKDKKKEEAQKLLKDVFSSWDKAAKRNIIHKNAASNQKARLSRLVSTLK